MGRLEDAVEVRKQQLISKLLKHHIYKKDGQQLYELTLSEIERVYSTLYRKTS
ncbi:Fur-regulated basic protein FbpA [Alkalicoccobacillus plakortidis]|uniref:Fur-regulated basic protein FbpA n=1 Tax=Alkalicoccobacillus plakortidis TaxID=444060 RepID=A0ABT0XI60_9BACI|nr:Fur-regulated basic protein FbpA [Alkalicoccobacillus plakortidis]MCM2675400.1 Fur-regulated basic protein FbpA [Alkalicoccobacillus plakortidis]